MEYQRVGGVGNGGWDVGVWEMQRWFHVVLLLLLLHVPVACLCECCCCNDQHCYCFVVFFVYSFLLCIHTYWWVGGYLLCSTLHCAVLSYACCMMPFHGHTRWVSTHQDDNKYNDNVKGFNAYTRTLVRRTW